jgi:hypothetical protein
VEVYDRSDTVELFLNGKSQGKKKPKEYKAVFKLKYVAGILEAVAYDIKGNVTGRNKLDSATGKIKIKLIPEEEVITKGDIVYVPIEISGENGVVDSNSDCTINLTVIGGTLLGFGSANPCTEEVYDSGTFTTYQGRALAVVRGDREGEITIKAQSKKFPEAVTKVTVK